MSAFEKMFLSLGMAAGQLLDIDTETKQLVARLVFKAAQSGNVNVYLQKRLRWLEEHERDVDPPPTVHVTASFVDEASDRTDRDRRRKR